MNKFFLVSLIAILLGGTTVFGQKKTSFNLGEEEELLLKYEYTVFYTKIIDNREVIKLIVFKHPSSIDLEEERCLGMVSSSPWVENGPFIFQIPKGWILEVKNGRLEYHPPEAF